jgi:hypothetical protein
MRSATGWWRASLSRTDWVRDRRRSGSLRPRARTPAQHDLVAGLSEEGIRNIGTGPSGYEPALVLLRSSGLGHSTQTQGRGWELRSFEPPICRGLEPCADARTPPIRTNDIQSNKTASWRLASAKAEARGGIHRRPSRRGNFAGHSCRTRPQANIAVIERTRVPSAAPRPHLWKKVTALPWPPSLS